MCLDGSRWVLSCDNSIRYVLRSSDLDKGYPEAEMRGIWEVVGCLAQARAGQASLQKGWEAVALVT